MHALVPLSEVHVERVVTARLAVGPLPPLIEGCYEASARLSYHVVNCETHTNAQRQYCGLVTLIREFLLIVNTDCHYYTPSLTLQIR